MRIGQLAQRLRVSTRTLRHYEAIGLLQPRAVDDANGYRDYGASELLRGVRIEQLKATGLSLHDIRHVLDASSPSTFAQQRERLRASITESTERIRLIDALGAGDQPMAAAELIEEPAVEVRAVRDSSCPDRLGAAIRRHVQRLRRELRCAGLDAGTSFAARLPLDISADPIAFEVGARVPHPDRHSVTWPASLALRVELVGPLWMLPLAYDAALAAAEERDLTPTGSVRETYLDIGAVPRAAVAVAVRR